jgi:hypothetical protein
MKTSVRPAVVLLTILFRRLSWPMATWPMIGLCKPLYLCNLIF